MTATIFIDGEAGTTGLQIRDKLADLKGVALRSLPAEQRKDKEAKLRLMAEVDVVILCLPDEAAKEAAALIDGLGDRAPRVIDASSAHRVAPGWTYGFPELIDGQRAGDRARAQGDQSRLPRHRRGGAVAPADRRRPDPQGRADHDSVGQRLFGRRQGDDRGLRERPRAGLRALRRSASSTSTCRKSSFIRGSPSRPLFVPSRRQFPPGHARQRAAAARRARRQAERRRPARRARRALSRAALRQRRERRGVRRRSFAWSRNRSTEPTTC